MFIKEIFTKGFAPIILETVKSYNFNENHILKKKLKESCLMTLRKWSDRPPEMISEEAQKLATSLDLNPIEIKVEHRHKYHRRNADNKYNVLYEHTTPLSLFFLELLTCKDIACIENMLNNYSGICVITREEEDCLFGSLVALISGFKLSISC